MIWPVFLSSLPHRECLCLQEDLRKGKEEVHRLKAALLEQEAALLQRDRQLADLRKELTEAICKAEAPLQRDQAMQCNPLLQDDQATQVGQKHIGVLCTHCSSIPAASNVCATVPECAAEQTTLEPWCCTRMNLCIQ